MRRLVLLTLSFAVLGCDDEPSASTPAPEPPAETETAPPEPASEAPPPTARPSKEDLEREARADGEIVSAARTAAQEERFRDALSLLEPLVARTPRGARIHCRAGFYAQRAYRRDRAAELLDIGLRLHGAPEDVRQNMREPLAMCLYNRGRMHDDYDEQERAASLYRASLDLRPNATVERRLADLGDVTVAPYRALATDGSALEFPHRESGSALQPILESMASAVCEAARMPDAHEASDATCQMHNRPLRTSGEGPRVEWVVFRPDGSGTSFSTLPGWEDAAYLAIHPSPPVTQVFVVGPIALSDTGGQHAAIAAPDGARWVDVDGDGDNELIVETRFETSSSEDGCSDSSYARDMFVARTNERGWEARLVSIGHKYEETCYYDDEEQDSGHDSPFYAAALSTPGDGRFHYQGEDEERAFTLDELFDRCPPSPICSLNIATGRGPGRGHK